MKKITLVLVILFSVCSFGQVGTIFTSGGIKYNITAATTVEVGQNIAISGVVVIPATVNYNNTNYQVTRIGNYAFQYGISSVTIPNTITSIGIDAFRNCTSLTAIAIPTSVTSIGNDAFAYCTGLTSVTIPNSVTSISTGTFSQCSGLTSVTIPNSVKSIGSRSFDGCFGLISVTIPNSVTSIGSSAFSMCSSLTSINIPNSIISIEGGLFNGCTSLNSVNIPNSVTNIGGYAFRDCIGLTSITIPSSVTSIDEWTFYGCIGLTSVSVNWTTPLSIAPYVFSGGANISNITLYVPAGTAAAYDAAPVWTNFNPIVEIVVPPVLNQIFASNGINYIVTKATLPYEVAVSSNTSFVGTATIPASVTNSGNSFAVTSIGESAFSACSGLTSVDIPNSVLRIGSSAFYFCLGLTSVSIPNSVIIIDGNAFTKCTGLTSVNIPSSVSSIGSYAFQNCTGLTSVTVNWTTPLTINANVFGGVTLSAKTLNVPVGTAAAYDAKAVWTDFGSITEPIPASLYTAIPDANFEQALFDQGIDTVNGDKQVLTSAISGLTLLDVSNKNIASLTGIEAFSSLAELICYGNLLTNLSVNNLTGLQYLTCANNQLTSLNTTNLVALIDLDCSNNLITTLSLTTNTKLIWLSCERNQLTSLNLNGLVTLQTLDCSYNQLTSLNASGTDLRTLNCSNNYNEIVAPFTYLTNINLTGLSNLTNLNCSGNVMLANLNVSGLTNLTGLYLSYNNFSTINLSGLTNLWQLDINNNKLTTLDLSSNAISSFSSIFNPALSCISVIDVALAENAGWSIDSWTTFKLPAAPCLYTVIPDANFEQALIDLGFDGTIDGKILTSAVANITSLDVSNKNISSLIGIKSFAALQDLNCSSNSISSLDIVGLNQIKTFDGSYNNMVEFLMTNTANLTSLQCQGNNLETLNLSGLTNLITLNCGSNQISNLNFTGVTQLTTLDCSNNPLPTFDFTALASLSSLNCSSTQRTSLNVTGLTSLVSLDFSGNQLTSMNLSNLSKLKTLDCSGNLLTSINLSGLTALETLSCGRNQFTSLSLTNMPTLKNLYCDGGISFSFVNGVLNSTVVSTLTSLTLTGLTNLENLNCSKNKLTTMILTGLTSLKTLNCGNNNFTTLSVNASNFPSLLNLDCAGPILGPQGNLTSLDVVGFSTLATLDCSRNVLDSLNVTGLANSATLNCSINPSLTCITVSDPAVAVANSNWRKDASASYALSCTLASHQHQFANDLVLYPNPTQTTLNISSTTTIDKITVADLTGKKVLEQKQNTTQVNVQNLAKGIYILEVFVGQNKQTRKFIKE